MQFGQVAHRYAGVDVMGEVVADALGQKHVLGKNALPDVVGEIMRIRVEHFDEGSE